MIRQAKLHIIPPDGEEPFRQPFDELETIPRQGDLISLPGEDEEYEVTRIKHFIEEDDVSQDDETDYTVDVYVETARPGDV